MMSFESFSPTEGYIFTMQGHLFLSPEMVIGDGDEQESSQLRDGVLSCGFGSGRLVPVQFSPVGRVVEAGDCSNKLGVQREHPRCNLFLPV